MEDLIESVKKHRALWDLSTKAYKDQAKRLEAWNLVAEECGLTQESAKAKWRGLRDTYIKFLKAQKRTPDQGRRKRKNYCYAEQMAFMKPFMINISTRAVKHQAVPTGIWKEPQADSLPHPMVEYESQDTIENLKRSRQMPLDKKNEGYEISWKNQSIDMDMDPTDMLFLSYAKTMKTFSKRRQIVFKRKIAELFADLELEQVTEEEAGFASSCASLSSTIEVSENLPNALPMSEVNECKVEFL